MNKVNDESSSEDSEDEEENKKGGTYNNYGFYKTTLDMIYGGADEDKIDLQKKFAEEEFESMNRNKGFGDFGENKTPTPTESSYQTPNNYEKIENEKEEKEKEEKEKEEKEKEEKEKEEKEKRRQGKRRQGKRKKKKRKEKRK